METKSLKVSDLYELRAEIYGMKNQRTGDVFGNYHGFVNESVVPESVKRRVYKIGKAIEEEIKSIQAQQEKIKAMKIEDLDANLLNSEKEKPENVNKEESEIAKALLAKEIEKKIKDLLDDKIEISIECPSFSFIENLSLKGNYQVLYDKCFID